MAEQRALRPTFTGIACALFTLGAAALSRCAASAPPARPAATSAPVLAAPPPQPVLEENAVSPGEPAAAPAPPSRRVYAVAAIGDSLTDASSHGGKYLEHLRTQCPRSRFDNYGKGGNMVNQMRRRFAPQVLGDPPDDAGARPQYSHLLVFGGVNDVLSNLTAARTRKNITGDLAAMYGAARERGMRVIALTIAPWGAFPDYDSARAVLTREVNQWIADQHSAGAIDHVVDAHALLSCGEPDRLCPRFAAPFKDGLHFGPEGHAVLGRALHERVFADCL
jgi:lysophospholipase L1-like esterase